MNAQKIIHTGNTTIDSILNFKKQIAESNNINIEIGITAIPEIQISNINLTIILGNLIDNAIEATNKVTDNRQIKIKIFSKANCLFIVISNPYTGSINKQDNLFISTKTVPEKHGFGLRNVFDAVSEHGGTMTIETEDHFFTVKVVLFNNAK